MWSVKCEVWGLECEGSSEKCGVWSVECEVWSLECEECSVQCEVWSVEGRTRSTLHTSHCSLHTPNLTLHTSHFTLRSSHSTLKLHTPHFTPHTSNCSKLTCNLDAAITMRSAKTELQNTIELRATGSEIAGPKPDLDARAKEKTILKHFLKGFWEGKSLAPKWRKSAHKSLSQPSCSHSNTIYEVQLQKTIVLRMQPWQEATLTQPLLCDLQRLSCKTQ